MPSNVLYAGGKARELRKILNINQRNTIFSLNLSFDELKNISLLKLWDQRINQKRNYKLLRKY